MTVSSVVFDLDGTLVETAPDLHAVLGEVMDEEGLPAPSLAELRHMVGDGARALIERALRAAGLAAPSAQRLDRLYARFLELYSARPARLSYPYPGVREALEALSAAGIRLGVCTNKPQRPSERLLEALDLDRYFGCVLGGDALPVRKPDPAHLRAVLERLGTPGDPAVMVGDSRNDLAAAQALGVPCVLVSFGYTPVPACELGADLVIDAYEELLPALGRLRRAA